MTDTPFAGLIPTPNPSHARWVVQAMEGQDGVALVIPSGFDAYARLLHPLQDGERWADVGPDYLRAEDEPYTYPFPEEVMSVEGDMGDALVDALIPMLTAATSTPERCHYALWSGWGEFNSGGQQLVWAQDPSGPPIDAAEIALRLELADAVVHAFAESCPVQPWWGGRDMLLFDGPLDAVTAIGSTPFDGLRRRGPQWWWPEDRSWFVATEIDFPWTYLGGSAALVDAVHGDPACESVPIDGAATW